MERYASALIPCCITLPPPLQQWLERTAEKFVYPEPGARDDFLYPAGEPALTDPDSVSWQIFRNPLALFIGGVAAVVLELAEPRVRTGVWEHTTFRQQPLQRLQRTGLAAMMTVYGPRGRVEAMTARIGKLHDSIGGRTPGGQPYRASDPELLNWVHATASFAFIEAYKAYVRRIDDAECDRYYREGMSSARLYGASGAAVRQEQIEAMFSGMRDKLEPSPIVFEFLDIMRQVPVLPRPFRRIQPMLVDAAIAIVPDWIRDRLELTGQWSLAGWQRQLVKSLCLATDRLMLRSSPAVQACRRLGLPDDYLHRQCMKRHSIDCD